VNEYNRDVQGAEKSKISAIELASKYCSFLVYIHPFEESNGRICHLLMNVVLLKYADTVMAIRINAQERKKYIEQAVRANREFTKQKRDDISWEEQARQTGNGLKWDRDREL